MTAASGPGLVDAFLAHHLRYRPVDATFMGIGGHDDILPPADAGTASEEKAGLEKLQTRLAAAPPGGQSRQADSPATARHQRLWR